MIPNNHIARQRLERGARHLHSLGPRAIAEFLAELARHSSAGPAVLVLLDRYANDLTPAMIRAAGADRFPPPALRELPRVAPSAPAGGSGPDRCEAGSAPAERRAA